MTEFSFIFVLCTFICEFSYSVNIAISKTSDYKRTIIPSELSLTLFFAVYERSLIFSFWSLLHAISLRMFVLPTSLIPEFVCLIAINSLVLWISGEVTCSIGVNNYRILLFNISFFIDNALEKASKVLLILLEFVYCA